MTLESALRLTEILLGLSLLQQSLEHLADRRPAFAADRRLFGVRAALCVPLVAGVASPWPVLGLAASSLLVLHRYQGPFNGGSDRMGLLALWCLAAARALPWPQWQEIALGYLGIQLVLSYFISGWVKVVNPDWRTGRALRDVFLFSAYPANEHLRGWAGQAGTLSVAAWTVMTFELAFPLALMSTATLAAALVAAALFHLANACLFGLNRFFWTWLSAYPAILWLQGRLLAAGP